jgi:hypothetical protein
MFLGVVSCVDGKCFEIHKPSQNMKLSSRLTPRGESNGAQIHRMGGARTVESTFGKMLNKLKTLSPHETIMLRIGERPATVNLK